MCHHRAVDRPSPRPSPDRRHPAEPAGRPTARWFLEQAVRSGVFGIKVVDLAETDLPLLAEPGHPSTREYESASTRALSEVVDRAAACIFVIPEYDHSCNAALKNALGHLFWQWHGRPVALVAYGGVAAGAGTAVVLEPAMISLQPHVVGVVPVPLSDRLLHPPGGPSAPAEPIEYGLTKALDALHRALQSKTA